MRHFYINPQYSPLFFNGEFVFDRYGPWPSYSTSCMDKAYDVAAATGNTTSFAIPSGSNRILVVGVTANNTASSTYTLSTLTYGGQNLTAATSNLGS